MALFMVMDTNKKKGCKMAKSIKVKEDKVSFFSESDMVIDKQGKKQIASEFPSWYNAQMMDELQEDIRRDEHALKNGYVKEAQIPAVQERLKSYLKKLDEIEASQPNFKGEKKDRVVRVTEYLGEQIRDKMFTRSQMQKGIADSHEEAKRMITPSILVTPEVAELAAACNVKPRDGKISRDEASKIWKISRRAIDESCDTEELRRD